MTSIISYCNNVQVLESSKEDAEWECPLVKSDKPSPKSDNEMFYTPSLGKLFPLVGEVDGTERHIHAK